MSTRTQQGFTGRWFAAGIVVAIAAMVLVASAVMGVGPFAGGGGNETNDGAGAEGQTDSVATPISPITTASDSVGTTDSQTATERRDAVRTTGQRTDSGGQSVTDSTGRASGSGTDLPGFDTPTPTPTRESITQTVSAARDEQGETAASERESTSAATDIASGMGANNDSAYTLRDFRRTLESKGVTVLTLSFDRTYPSNNATRPIVLEYATSASTQDGYRDEAGVVAEAYAEAVADGFQPRALYASGFDNDRQPVSSYRVERSWASAYTNGDLSGQEYGKRIAGTYQSFNGNSTTAESR